MLDGEDVEKQHNSYPEVGEILILGTVIKGRSVFLCNEKQTFCFGLLSWGIKLST